MVLIGCTGRPVHAGFVPTDCRAYYEPRDDNAAHDQSKDDDRNRPSPGFQADHPLALIPVILAHITAFTSGISDAVEDGQESADGEGPDDETAAHDCDDTVNEDETDDDEAVRQLPYGQRRRLGHTGQQRSNVLRPQHCLGIRYEEDSDFNLHKEDDPIEEAFLRSYLEQYGSDDDSGLERARSKDRRRTHTSFITRGQVRGEPTTEHSPPPADPSPPFVVPWSRRLGLPEGLLEHPNAAVPNDCIDFRLSNAIKVSITFTAKQYKRTGALYAWMEKYKGQLVAKCGMAFARKERSSNDPAERLKLGIAGAEIRVSEARPRCKKRDSRRVYLWGPSRDSARLKRLVHITLAHYQLRRSCPCRPTGGAHVAFFNVPKQLLFAVIDSWCRFLDLNPYGRLDELLPGQDAQLDPAVAKRLELVGTRPSAGQETELDIMLRLQYWGRLWKSPALSIQATSM